MSLSLILMSTRQPFGLLALLVSLAGTYGCKTDVAKERNEQNHRMDTEGREKVRSEYFTKYKSHPDDPAITYLYARMLDDPAEKKPIVEQLVAKHPEFPWGHLALRGVLVEQGQFEKAADESAKAAQLDPNTSAFSEALKEDKDVVVIEPANHMRTFMKVVDKVDKTASGTSKRADTSSGLASVVIAQSMYKNLDFIKSEFSTPVKPWNGTEMLASVLDAKENGESHTVVLLHVKQSGKEDIVLEGSDVKKKNAVACYTVSGKRVDPISGQFWQGQTMKDSCRTCENIDIRIPPNETRTIDASFAASKASLSRCVFFNVPTKNAKVVVAFSE